MNTTIKLPLILLAIGDLNKDKKLLSVRDTNNTIMIPVFTDPECAEQYRQWQTTNINQTIIQISAFEPPKHNPHQVNAFVITELQSILDILDLATINAPTTLIALNPNIKGEHCLCFDMEEFTSILNGDDPQS